MKLRYRPTKLQHKVKDVQWAVGHYFHKEDGPTTNNERGIWFTVGDIVVYRNLK